MASVQAVDYEELIQEDRVHGQLYYDPAIFHQEMEKIWHRQWVYVGHESEVSQPGDYVTRQIGLQPVIMTRDKEGTIQLLLNRCMHRGNLVCESGRGNTQEFRCIYHGWTYSTKGDLLGAPYSAAYGASFRKEDYGLAKVPRVGSYRGFIFASLSPTGSSLDEHLGYAKGLIDQFVEMSPEGEVELCAGTQKQRYRGNWKMQVENAVDNYHTTFVHQTANDIMKIRSGVDLSQTTSEQSPAVSRYLGGGHALFDFRPLQARANEWLVLRRGLHRERIEEGGVRTGHIADEGHVRGIWRHYQQLMLQP